MTNGHDLMGEILLISFVLFCIKIDLSSWQVVVSVEMVCGDWDFLSENINFFFH